MRLSVRLQNIADQVDKRRVCDIGCDHGKLVEYLFDQNKIDYAFLSDVSMPSVQKAVALMGKKNVQFDWVCADGTQGIQNQNIEQGIISGMGGIEIIKILTDDKTNISSWVLQPQNNEICLKKFLIKNKFKIVKDFIVKDKNIYYNILKVEKTQKKQKVSKFYLYFGKDNFAHNIYFRDYLEYMENKYQKILCVVSRHKKWEIKKILRYIKKAKMESK